MSASKLPLTALAVLPNDSGVKNGTAVEVVWNATAPTRTHPALISAASASTASAANFVSVVKVAGSWSSQNSVSTIDVDASITNTISACG